MNEIAIQNSGLVLLNGYFQLLFERLNLTTNRQFVSSEAQSKAVNLLQFIATGRSQTEEHYLILNKILCGLSPNSIVEGEITLQQHEKETIEGMLEAAIGHWPAIGGMSVDGFRGNWLIRNGLISEHENKWELTVEKHAYDILLHKSPYSFSIIKLHWMDRPLHVTWSY